MATINDAQGLDSEQSSVPYSIANSVASCFESFNNVQACLENDRNSHHHEDFLEAVQSLQGRLRVWCGNLGAHQIGKASLDSRLKDAPSLSSKVHQLLESFQSLLSEVLAITSGQREAAEDRQYDSDSSEGSEAMSNDDQDGEMTQIFKELQEVLDCLYRMSMNLRNPGGNRRYAKAAKIDVSFFETYDIQFMKDIFPQADGYLCDRLGKAISRRRQFLKYQGEHAAKLAHGVELDEDDPARSETTASTLLQDPSAVHASQTPMRHSFTDDVSLFSATSYATVPGNTRSIKWPPLPKISESSSPYECPYCHIFIEAQTTHDWRKHVVRDLRPYMCTFETCITASEMYETRREWYRHELEYHRRTWICISHCSREFSTRSDFAKHTKKILPRLTDDQMHTLVQIAARSIDTGSVIPCPICKEGYEGSARLGKHIARHLEEIALRALPPSPNDETDSDPGSSSSDGSTGPKGPSLTPEVLASNYQDVPFGFPRHVSKSESSDSETQPSTTDYEKETSPGIQQDRNASALENLAEMTTAVFGSSTSKPSAVRKGEDSNIEAGRGKDAVSPAIECHVELEDSDEIQLKSDRDNRPGRNTDDTQPHFSIADYISKSRGNPSLERNSSKITSSNNTTPDGQPLTQSTAEHIWRSMAGSRLGGERNDQPQYFHKTKPEPLYVRSDTDSEIERFMSSMVGSAPENALQPRSKPQRDKKTTENQNEWPRYLNVPEIMEAAPQSARTGSSDQSSRGMLSLPMSATSPLTSKGLRSPPPPDGKHPTMRRVRTSPFNTMHSSSYFRPGTSSTPVTLKANDGRRAVPVPESDVSDHARPAVIPMLPTHGLKDRDYRLFGEVSSPERQGSTRDIRPPPSKG
ncbi:hypothetical protein MMC10_001477 [Thelotrema lepadinum]|nr:hypothetical protein [Thelotrema lepadinum]